MTYIIICQKIGVYSDTELEHIFFEIFIFSGKSLLNGEFKLFLANPKSKKGDVLHEAYFSKIEEIFTTLSEYIEN